MGVQPVNTALPGDSVDGNGAGFEEAIATANERNAGAQAAGEQEQISQEDFTRMIGQYGSRVVSMLLMPRMTDMLGEAMADEDG